MVIHWTRRSSDRCLPWVWAREIMGMGMWVRRGMRKRRSFTLRKDLDRGLQEGFLLRILGIEAMAPLVLLPIHLLQLRPFQSASLLQLAPLPGAPINSTRHHPIRITVPSLQLVPRRREIWTDTQMHHRQCQPWNHLPRLAVLF